MFRHRFALLLVFVVAGCGVDATVSASPYPELAVAVSSPSSAALVSATPYDDPDIPVAQPTFGYPVSTGTVPPATPTPTIAHATAKPIAHAPRRPTAAPSSTPKPTAPATPKPTVAPIAPPIPTPVPPDPAKPLPKYVDSNWVNNALVKDADGVVMVPYGGTLGNQYNPTRVAQQGFGYYSRWLDTGSQDDLQQFFIQADWLAKTETTDGRFLYTFPWGDQPVPWWSAMAQGQAMSLLIRAYWLKKDPAYLQAIQRARTTFERSIAQTGVISWITVGGVKYAVYEEALGTYCPRVLNGWIYAIIGLYEDWAYLGDPKAKFDVVNGDRGFAAVERLLPYYDTGTWTYYNLASLTATPRGYLAQDHYQTMHVVQLRYLAKITSRKIYSMYAERFAQYMRDRGLTPPA